MHTKTYLFIRGAVVLMLLVLSTAARSQKVIDSISRESCDCMEKLLSIMKLPVEDSLTNCVTVSINNHLGAFGKEKKLNPGTEKGIQEIHERVRKSLKKKCRVFTGE
jgi:hypothetical protein